MIETRPLVGVIPVVQTPLTVDRDIDIQAIHRHIDFLEARKVGGYWALGTGSEDMNLTFAERLTAARALCEANDGRLPLILGA
ncbi:MAG: dihydrodipicolinate synthase family protein, partial [Pseudomonadota bacterium]